MTVGELINRARKQSKLSQRELAEKLGVSASMIGQYENDLRKPKIETIQRIANALGVDPASLMDFDTVCAYNGGIFRVPHTIEYDFDKINKELGLGEAEYKNIELLLGAFEDLNEDGQKKAIERVEELTEIPKYQKAKPPQD